MGPDRGSGRIDEDGALRITGRIKDVIIRNMENVSAIEVENVISEIPLLADVAVIGLPDDRTGERVCAVVVLKEPGGSMSLATIADWCLARGLAKNKLPESVFVVESIPRNSNGKPMKNVLKEQALAEAYRQV